jgi:hypothetical protein
MPPLSIDFRNNPQWGGLNMHGAVAKFLGRPTGGLRRTETRDDFASDISKSRGQHVRPVFLQRAGLLEYIWFSHCQAVPAILYDWSVNFLGPVRYTWHRDGRAIHIWQSEKLAGLLWRCHISAAEVLASARQHLLKSFRNT